MLIGTLPVDAELDMFADIAQQPEQKGIALRRQQEPAQAQAQVAASAPGMVLPAQPQPKQEAPSMQAQHAAAPQHLAGPVPDVQPGQHQQDQKLEQAAIARQLWRP